MSDKERELINSHVQQIMDRENAFFEALDGDEYQTELKMASLQNRNSELNRKYTNLLQACHIALEGSISPEGESYTIIENKKLAKISRELNDQ